MPPKAHGKVSSSSRDVVPVGRRDVFKDATKSEKQEKIVKASTERALILRNGKYGSQGTGELMFMGRMTGREKLDLLAEDLVERSKTAILAPFRLETCLKNAESQADAYVDQIVDLQDPDLFQGLVEAELDARTDPAKDPRKNPTTIAKLVAAKIHNTYMLASAWKIVSDFLNQLALDGLTDQNIRNKLKSDPSIRIRYLIIYDVVNDLVTTAQNRFAVLATTAPHYAKYFKIKQGESINPNDPEFVFDWNDNRLREVGTSFLDSIIIELCFPRGIYPQEILYRILHDAVEESPKEAKRFPQILWDAVGDLSRCVELHEIMSAPLFGLEGDKWKKEPRQMPEEYEKWIDAQIFSEKASELYSNFKDIIFPLEKSKRRNVLENMWNQINNNYVSVSGERIDSLWALEEAFSYAPQWSARHRGPGYDSDDDAPPNRRSVVISRKNNSRKKPLAITARDGDASDSMPELQSVSNTSDNDTDGSDDDSDSDEEESDEETSDDESGYNTDEENEIREMWREAMDAAHEADFLDSGVDIPEINPFSQEDLKGNPFLKLLGSLRGRMFSSSPKLKTTNRTEPRHASAIPGTFRPTSTEVLKEPPKGASKAESAAPPPSRVVPTSVKATAALPPKSMKATVEDAVDAEDEGNASTSKKKKKKKPKKKKKNDFSEATLSPTESVQSVDTITGTAAVQSTPEFSTSTKKAPSTSPNMAFSSSTTSLPITSQSAQSAHSYLSSLKTTEKKIKSRPNHASLFTNAPKKSSLFSKATGASKKNEPEKEESSGGLFKSLSKKANRLMNQLLRTEEDKTRGLASMKWEHFLKVMREMGFEYDPSTAGSSVRFDPPDKRDRPITFHKPHPDTTLEPIMVKQFARRLKRYYGWNEDVFLRG